MKLQDTQTLDEKIEIPQNNKKKKCMLKGSYCFSSNEMAFKNKQH